MTDHEHPLAPVLSRIEILLTRLLETGIPPIQHTEASQAPTKPRKAKGAKGAKGAEDPAPVPPVQEAQPTPAAEPLPAPEPEPTVPTNGAYQAEPSTLPPDPATALAGLQTLCRERYIFAQGHTVMEFRALLKAHWGVERLAELDPAQYPAVVAAIGEA